MAVALNPYLSFRHNAREAMEFYRTVFGGKLNLLTFKEYNLTFKEYNASQDPSEDNKIMHASLEGNNGIVFMAADTPSSMEHRPGTTMSMSLSGNDEQRLRGYWEELTQGATVTMPLEKAPWGDTFGMLRDKFGVAWLVNISPQ